MTAEDDEIQRAPEGTLNVPSDSRRRLYSWSSYLDSSPIQFRTPSYTKEKCEAPRLKQGNFGDGSTPDVEKQEQLGDQQGMLTRSREQA